MRLVCILLITFSSIFANAKQLNVNGDQEGVLTYLNESHCQNGDKTFALIDAPALRAPVITGLTIYSLKFINYSEAAACSRKCLSTETFDLEIEMGRFSETVFGSEWHNPFVVKIEGCTRVHQFL